MTTVAVVIILVAIAAGLGAAVGRRRYLRRLTDRIDAIAGSIGGVADIASVAPDAALDRLERALERSRTTPAAPQVEADRYRAALSSITLGVVLVDERARVRYRNPFAESFMSGRHGEAVVGQVIDELAAAAVVGETAEREVQIYGPPRRKLFVAATPIIAGARRLGAVVLIDDITEQERIDAIRRDFVANISHELRTPIGAMSLLAETLVDETDPALVSSLAARISDESTRLGQTIEDLLQLSRIEHGSDESFGPVVLQRVIATAADRVRSAAEHARVDIGVTLPERELVVRGDELQLASAIYNLLDNAVKYIGSDGGNVSVRARLLDDQVEVIVQDSGIGIPRRDLDRIFERFYRVDRGRSRTSGGTGLGLSIVRHVVANHGGRVAVDSTEGEGSTFTMQFPVFTGPDTDPPEPGQSPPAPSRDEGTTTR